MSVNNPYCVNPESLTTRDKDYGYFSLSANVTINSETSGTPVDTAEVINGDISMESTGIQLIGGRTYEIAIYGRIGRQSATYITPWHIRNITNGTQISQSAYPMIPTTELVGISSPYVSCIYTPASDCIIGIYNEESAGGVSLTCYAGYVTAVVKELSTKVIE